MALRDTWHRTLVYFGLAEDRDAYEEEESRPSRRRCSRTVTASAPTSAASRPAGAATRSTTSSPTTPRRRPALRPLRPAEPAGNGRRESSRVHLVIPKSFNDAQDIADKFKDSIPVIVNLQGIDRDLSKRLVDFASGLTYALDGGMQQIADKVFLLTPRNVEVSAEERARLIEKGFFNQS